MKLRYGGGRSRYEVTLNRRAYHFTPENQKTIETNDQELVNYIFSLENRGEFSVVVDNPVPIPQSAPIETSKENKLLCKKCGFIAKSETGLMVHQAKHKR